MLVSRLIPTLVLGAITVHSGPALKARFAASFGVVNDVMTKQRIGAVIDSCILDEAGGDGVEFANEAQFRAYVRAHVRLKNGAKGDSSLDLWGTPLYGKLTGRRLRITSAGPDREFDTKDDLVIERELADY